MRFSEFLNEAFEIKEAPWAAGGHWKGDINVSGWSPKLTSLNGMPATVTGSFICEYNALTSLKHGPTRVDGSYKCSYNKLTSLEHAPTIPTGEFLCNANKLTTLEGAPTSVTSNFDCGENKLTSLKGAPKIVHGDFLCYGNLLTSIDGLPETIEGTLGLTRNDMLKAFPALRLLKVKGLRRIALDNKPLERILNQYIAFTVKNNDTILECQNVLIDSGFEEYASL